MRPSPNDGTCNSCRDARSVRPSPLKPTDAVTFDTTNAQATRFALTQRTHRSCVPTAVTRPIPPRPHIRGNLRFPREEFLIRHGGMKKFFRTSISFFRSFISFFRSFISVLRGEFSFPRELFGESSVGIIRCTSIGPDA